MVKLWCGKLLHVLRFPLQGIANDLGQHGSTIKIKMFDLGEKIETIMKGYTSCFTFIWQIILFLRWLLITWLEMTKSVNNIYICSSCPKPNSSRLILTDMVSFPILI